MNINIELDMLSDGAVNSLLQSHLLEMHKYSPAESIHALDSQQSLDPSITYWSARNGSELLGCGALKELSPQTGEIKSMKTSDKYLRMGIGKKILEKILAEAKQRAYLRVSLETGSLDAFKPAIKLYKKFGFVECGPFADYKLDPFSRFFTKDLTKGS